MQLDGKVAVLVAAGHEAPGQGGRIQLDAAGQPAFVNMGLPQQLTDDPYEFDERTRSGTDSPFTK